MTHEEDSDMGMTTGDVVEKSGGDYTFGGTVVTRFAKRSGAFRYVVEDDCGILHVFTAKNLRPRPAMAKPRFSDPQVQEPSYRIGEPVSKVGGDYRFDGVVVACFYKLSGLLRFVVEDDRGIVHIFNSENLTPREPQRS